METHAGTGENESDTQRDGRGGGERQDGAKGQNVLQVRGLLHSFWQPVASMNERSTARPHPYEHPFAGARTACVDGRGRDLERFADIGGAGDGPPRSAVNDEPRPFVGAG